MNKNKQATQSAPAIGAYSKNLRELKKEVTSVGSADGNYVGKFRLILKASAFAPEEEEVPLLLKHIFQVYLIFVLQLCYTGIVSWYMYLHPDLLMKLLTVLLSAYGLVFLAVDVAFVLLLFLAQSSNSLFLGLLATTGITTVIGIPIGLVPIFYDKNIILEALLLTIIIFIGSALFGLMTKNNLTGWSAPLTGGLLALIVLGFFQYYYQNSIWNILILVADIVVFTLYTAYDNQMIKIRFLDKLRDDIPDSSISWWLLVMSSSIDIYLDFVNLFLDILSILGDDD